MTSSVAALLSEDRWTVASDIECPEPYIIRFREPVLTAPDTHSHPHRLSILWAFADEGSNELPTPAQDDEMARFETHLCEAQETDGHAIHTVVITSDGARQWVFYTADVPECGERIGRMPHYDGPYPIELCADEDPGWSYLRRDILQIEP
jgi:hypothetical protein